jgi:endonuclease YncB( thermonuclease family)
LLRYVVVGNTLANLEMLKQGHAALDPADTGFACLATFQAAEDEARAAKLGIWK